MKENYIGIIFLNGWKAPMFMDCRTVPGLHFDVAYVINVSLAEPYQLFSSP